MNDEGRDVAEQLLEETLAAAPHHRPGTRATHAPGIAAEGWFQATAIASNYTVAEHFSGRRIRVTVRFSNGTGEPRTPDCEPNLVRGMAVKFHLEEGERQREADLIAMNLPLFFVRRVPQFHEFAEAALPHPVKRQSRLHKVMDMLALREPLPELKPGQPSNKLSMLEFVEKNDYAAAALVNLGMLPVPASYSTCSYSAVHAFVLTDEHGVERSVRFRWEPVDGVRATKTEEPEYLFGELRESLARNAIEFVLRMQVAEQGDDPTDPTTLWSQRRPRIVMGHLLLDKIAPDQPANAQQISFNVGRLVDGIACSDDEILKVRVPVYELGCQRRREEAGEGSTQTMTRTSGAGRSAGA